ncbi:MAG: hypothetical protein AAGB48_03325 [Planctomycetota bacterium]
MMNATFQSMRRWALTAAGVGLVSLGVVGCGSMPALDADAPAPGLILGARSAGDSPFAADRAISADAIVARYVRYTGGSAKPKPERSEMRVVPDEDGWSTERWLLPRNPGGDATLERRIRLSRGGDGSILLHESSGGEEDFTTRFDPPVRLAAALMRPGNEVVSAFRVRVMDNDSGGDFRSGNGTARVTYAGRQRVETPMGVFDADLLMTELSIESGIATIERRQRQWIATVRPGRSMIVAEAVHERVEVFGFDRERRMRMVIESIVR